MLAANMTTRTCSESLDMPRRWSVEVGPRISEAILPAKLFPDSLPTHESETSVNSDRNRRQENLKGSACLERLVARTEVHAIRGAPITIGRNTNGFWPTMAAIPTAAVEPREHQKSPMPQKTKAAWPRAVNTQRKPAHGDYPGISR